VFRYDPPTLYLLDTNTVSHILRPQKYGAAARDRLEAVGQNEYTAISVITEAELLYGLAKKPEASALKKTINAFLATINVLPWSRAEAEVYSVLRADLDSHGRSIGNLDMLITAHAVSARAILVTNDGPMLGIRELYGDSLRMQDWTVSS
jgi:tRNA(fMet)-specific endonuclease VapC